MSLWSQISGPLIMTLQIAVPFLLAGSGELLNQKAGNLNIGIEGMMITGALVGFLVSNAVGSAWLGLIVGGLSGLAISLIHVTTSLFFKVDQVTSGTGIWLFGLGLTAYVGSMGIGETTLKPILGKLTPLFFIAVATPWIIWFIIYKTNFGMKIRASGENPFVAELAGVNVTKIQFITIIVGGFLAGLSGAYITIVYSPIWSRGITAGRGWIALSLVFFALWEPKRLFWGSFVFGFFWMIGVRGQLWTSIPPSLLRTVPYIATIIVLWIASSGIIGKMRTKEPNYLGKPYIRER